MNLAQLKQQLMEAAQKCDDAEAAQRALAILQNARGGTSNGAPAIVTEDGSGMSREEFMRRLRGGA